MMNSGFAGNNPVIGVYTLTDNTLLLEDGVDHILMENGNRILLENNHLVVH